MTAGAGSPSLPGGGDGAGQPQAPVTLGARLRMGGNTRRVDKRLHQSLPQQDWALPPSQKHCQLLSPHSTLPCCTHHPGSVQLDLLSPRRGMPPMWLSLSMLPLWRYPTLQAPGNAEDCVHCTCPYRLHSPLLATAPSRNQKEKHSSP